MAKTDITNLLNGLKKIDDERWEQVKEEYYGNILISYRLAFEDMSIYLKKDTEVGYDMAGDSSSYDTYSLKVTDTSGTAIYHFDRKRDRNEVEALYSKIHQYYRKVVEQKEREEENKREQHKQNLLTKLGDKLKQ